METLKLIKSSVIKFASVTTFVAVVGMSMNVAATNSANAASMQYIGYYNGAHYFACVTRTKGAFRIRSKFTDFYRARADAATWCTEY